MSILEWLGLRKPKPKPYIEVSLEDIKKDTSRLDCDTRDYYVELLKTGAEIPPITLKRIPGGRYEIVDGHCRVEAHKILGLKKIKAVFSTVATKTVYVEPSNYSLPRQETVFICPILSAEVSLSNCQLIKCKSFQKNRCVEQPPQKSW